MEVEFPTSDDDSIYSSENEVVIVRPPLSPDAIIISGSHAKELDDAMDIIEAEEMSSEEEDMSETSTQALTDSLDPISDDDMIDVSSKSHLDDDVMIDSQSPKPDPTNVAVHTSLITPSSSDDPPLDSIASTNSAGPLLRDDSDEDNMVSVPGIRHSTDAAMDGTRDTEDLLVSPQTPSKSFVVDERPVPVNLSVSDKVRDDVDATKSSAQTGITQPATEITDLKSTGHAVGPENTGEDGPGVESFFSETTVQPQVKGTNQEDDSGLKKTRTSVVVFDAKDNDSSPSNSDEELNQSRASSLAARLAAFGSSIVKKSVEEKAAVNNQAPVESTEELESNGKTPVVAESDVSIPPVNVSETIQATDNQRDDAGLANSIPPQPSIDINKDTSENRDNSEELLSVGKLANGANTNMYADKPSSPSSDELDDMFYDAQTVPEPSKHKSSLVSKPATDQVITELENQEPFQDDAASKEDPKSPIVSNEEARQIELAQASLDVPDVEDVTDSKKRALSEKKQVTNETDLEDLDVNELGSRKSSRAGEANSPVPDFPAMDEIDINRSVEKSGDQFIPHQPKKKREAVDLEMDEDGKMYGADEFVEEKSVDLRKIPESVKGGATITKTELTTPLNNSKSGKKPAASKSIGSGGFGIFSMSSFYRAFRKPSKTKVGEMEAGSSSERDLKAEKSTDNVGSSEKKKKRSKKEIAREKERGLSSVSESVQTTGASVAVSEGDAYLEYRTPEELAEEERHLRLEETLKSQISTLRSARSGFVDLALLTPMTEKTLAAVDFEAKRILSQLPEVERRKEVLGRQVEILELTTEAELSAKEKTLVAAKIKVVEARCELDKLRHELFVIKRDIAKPGKAAAQERLRLSVRREKAEKDFRAATESKETMERNLEQRKAMLKTYRSEVSRLEKSVRDVEGDWA